MHNDLPPKSSKSHRKTEKNTPKKKKENSKVKLIDTKRNNEARSYSTKCSPKNSRNKENDDLK